MLSYLTWHEKSRKNLVSDLTESFLIATYALLLFCFVMYVYVACLIGIFSKLRTLNLLSEPFDEQQFFVNEDEFNNTTGDRNAKPDIPISKRLGE
jgi:hypothetical protein